MKFVFVRTPKPRRFYHKNIYYDPEKEEREERENRINKELGLNKDKPFVTSISRGSFRRNQLDNDGSNRADMRRERRAANIRFIIIVVVLILVAVFLYYTSGAFLAL